MENTKTNSAAKNIHQQTFPPVICVLGHVDHGKTTLLDTIRKTSVAQKEHGGITQKIGASRVEIVSEGQKRSITFIDTPGHEAFSLMRTRGAKAADIGLLVVSLTDGVMPQTKESIRLFEESKIPFIVVLTKADVTEKMPEKVKQQLLKEGVMLEGFGGDVSGIEVSAKTGFHIKELLELILLVYELNLTNKVSEKPSEEAALSAIVIESRRDMRSGPLTTIVVKNGTVAISDELLSGQIKGKVKALITDSGTQVTSATIGDAVSVLGFEDVPKVGSMVHKKHEIKASESSVPHQPAETQLLASSYISEKEKGSLSLILCVDALGSLEAILASLPKDVYVVSAKTGEISEADVLLGKATGSLIIGFNSKIRTEVEKLAQVEKVLFKNYSIIYELLDEIQDVLKGKKLALLEKIYGTATVLASFPFEKTQVMGIKVLDGRIAKGDKVRLARDETVIGESRIGSVRQGKNAVSKAEKGQEAGVVLSPFLDFTIGDMLSSIG